MSRKLAIGAALGAVLVFAGVSYAVIPSNNVIDGCYSKSGGALRVIDGTVTKCGKSETALAWNVQGPKGDKGDVGATGAVGSQGPQGIQGPAGSEGQAGPKGDTGAAGTSTGFMANMFAIIPLAGTETVLSKTLPAGNYVLYASVGTQYNLDEDFGSGYCSLPGATGPLVRPAGSVFYLPTSVTSAVTHSGGAIELKCTEVGGDLQIRDALLTGVKVDSLG